LNAARRAPEDDVETALRVLRRATNVRDIIKAGGADVERLDAYRRAVQAEVDRVSRIPPQIYGDAAVLRFASAAQIHPIIATLWSRRLAPAVVIAANDGYLLGRVNFATAVTRMWICRSGSEDCRSPRHPTPNTRMGIRTQPAAACQLLISNVSSTCYGREPTRSGLTRSRAAGRKREPTTR
jgi:hypothetical protein